MQRSAQKSVQDEKIRQQNMKIKDLEKIKQQKEQLEQQLKEQQAEVKQLQKKLKKQRQNGIKYVTHGHIRWAG